MSLNNQPFLNYSQNGYSFQKREQEPARAPPPNSSGAILYKTMPTGNKYYLLPENFDYQANWEA
jgi:hypothetical protein